MDKSVQNYSKSAEYANKNRRITYVSLRPVAKVARGMQLFCMTDVEIRKNLLLLSMIYRSAAPSAQDFSR